MSQIPPGEGRNQEVIDAQRGSVRCRIPQRLSPGRARVPVKIKPVNTSEAPKPKPDVVAVQHGPTQPRNAPRPRSDESRPQRPKSAGRAREDVTSIRQGAPRTPRSEREKSAKVQFQKPSTIPKRVMIETLVPVNKGRPVITVPISQKQQPTKFLFNKNGLPDQETIKKCEEMELKRQSSDVTEMFNESYNNESITSRSDKVKQLQLHWQQAMNEFQNMKTELSDRQKALLELYSKMSSTQQKMNAMGQIANLPPAKDLRIMNLSNMTPDQLLQLCCRAHIDEHDADVGAMETHFFAKNGLSIDMSKLYNMPAKLVATCEQTIIKRKEIIDWFETLKTEEKGISIHKLSKKIQEFNAENDMLKGSLKSVQAEFLKELNEIIDCLRKGVNETISLQVRTDELTCELSELNSQNADLRKQLHAADHLKSQNNKHRIEELEKEIKEEKCKKMVMRDRLSRTEGQVKIGIERASQLEAALEQARSQTWTLERNVQQLQEQNQKLQTDFDRELNKLTDSIRENTVHLEEIAEDRKKLQTEKYDLEERLRELSNNYNETLQNINHQLNLNVATLIETKNKLEEEKEERKKLESQLESICTQLSDSELHNNDMFNKLKEKESLLIELQNKMEATKRELELANIEKEDYRNQSTKQVETIREIERNFKEMIDLKKSIKCDLNKKEEYIAELENKQTLLEQQLQESEQKMESYEEQLSSLKNEIRELQKDFGEFENISELHEMVTQQRAKLLEATRQNGELAEELQKKDMELEHHVDLLTEQEHLLEQKNDVLKILSEKEEEQANIIKLLRNNLEMRARADNDLSQRLSEKNAEIDSLITNVETRKQQISQLEKIILTLEDQLRKVNLQRRKDHEKVSWLEKKIVEYESYLMNDNKRSIEPPADNMDNLIKILEDELSNPYDSRINSKDQDYNIISIRTNADRNKRDKHNKFECHDRNDNTSIYQTEQEKMPTKIVMGNFVKKTYISSSDEQHKGDNLNRKKAITNIDTQRWTATPEPGINVYTAPTAGKDNFQPLKGMLSEPHRKKDSWTRNLQFLMSNQMREDKKCKMFKFAGHRL